MIKNLDEVLNEIKDRADIVEVISDYIELKKVGNNHRGLCPFHAEKTPSFYVSDKKNLFHCFGCGVGGDVITFLMKYENIEFLEAVDLLASRYGINIAEKELNPGYKQLYDIHLEFSKEAENRLYSDEGKQAFEYLKSRGIGKDLIGQFRIGYIPKNNNFSKLLNSFDIKVIKESGLFFMKNSSYRSRFDGRILIPIKNNSGKIVAFSGRTIDGSLPKYLNSPETTIFRKREVLFNFDSAKKVNNNPLFLVEGFFDVIIMHKYGFMPAVCTMGTAISPNHIKLIKRHFKEVILIFDGDNAGRKAAFRSLETFLTSNFAVNVVFLPEGEDPDSYIRKFGREAFKELVENKKDLFLKWVETEFSALTSINQRAQFLERVKLYLDKIKNPYMRNLYIKEISKIIEVDEAVLYGDLYSLNLNDKSLKKKKGNHINLICERNFLKALFELPEDVVRDLIFDLDEDYFNENEMRELFKKIVENLEKGINICNLVRDNVVGELVSSLIMMNLEGCNYKALATQNKNKIIFNYINKKKKNLAKKLQHIRDKEDRNSILSEINRLIEMQKDIYCHLMEEG
ncbi:MAG: DNA primase [Deferribacterota bacterium]|nr:DNA primase [Deferribacterota bacterium]